MSTAILYTVPVCGKTARPPSVFLWPCSDTVAMSTESLTRKEKKARRQEVDAALETFMGKVEMLTLPHFDQGAVKEALSRMLVGELTTADLRDIVKEQLEKADMVSSEGALERLGNSFAELDLEFSDIMRSEIDEEEVAYVPVEVVTPVVEQTEPVEEEEKVEEAAFVVNSIWDSDEFDFAERPEFSAVPVPPAVTEAPAPAEAVHAVEVPEETPEAESAAEETPEEQPWRSDFSWGDDDGSLTFSDQVELDVEESLISTDFKAAEDG